MDPELEKLRIATPLPSPRQRIVWWLGIYLTGALILPVLLTLKSTHFEPLSLLLEFAVSSLAFPLGFLGIPEFIAVLIHLPATTQSDSTGRSVAAYMTVVIPLAYALYITHFVYTLKAKTLHAIRYLLVALVAIVVLNIAGCYAIGADMGNAESVPSTVQK